ncbi:PLD nuclease N-terminal domain-containing protein [uncultured Tateyamaria sp.]|uniref:PLD nuclease N-terminal domain-containing protein n=1 Tax=uncultured Tateyamaria sp. TaxID=455651 RepID=UPI00262068D6|nr:PLD nuclease N-terminal domain-containing protein [uncultured Tateyamaria sp.]
MGIEVAGIGGFILLVLNIWALVSIVSSGASTGKKVLWCLFVLILPLIGFIVWLLAGPRGKTAAA